MYKLILVIFLSILGVATTEQTDTKVYICQGSMSECYHKTKDCRGLENCSTDIKEITLEQAKQLGRRPCGYCYKKAH